MNLWPLCAFAKVQLEQLYILQIYDNNQHPPDSPIAVVVKFDNYTGPSISQSLPFCVPIIPITASTQLSNGFHER